MFIQQALKHSAAVLPHDEMCYQIFKLL